MSAIDHGEKSNSVPENHKKAKRELQPVEPRCKSRPAPEIDVMSTCRALIVFLCNAKEGNKAQEVSRFTHSHILKLEAGMNNSNRNILFLSSICVTVAMSPAIGQQVSWQQNVAAHDTIQQTAEKPPHVDQEPNPEDRKLEDQIKGELQQDPHMAYSRVRVHVTDNEVLLSGVVLTAAAKDQAAKIANEHASGRKITNHIKVNSNTHPGSGF